MDKNIMISRYSSTDGIYIDKNFSDLIKLFACIMVALHHYSQNAISIGYNHNIILQAFSTQGGYLGVALFFFMSGYGLMISEKKCHLKLLPYLKKRLSKILIPSALVTIIWFALQIGLNIGFFWGGVKCRFLIIYAKNGGIGVIALCGLSKLFRYNIYSFGSIHTSEIHIASSNL